MFGTASFGFLDLLVTGPLVLGAVMVCPGIVGLGYMAMVGARLGFGACSDPYWHHDRYTEVVEPC